MEDESPSIIYRFHYGSWQPGDARSQGICNHIFDKVFYDITCHDTHVTSLWWADYNYPITFLYLSLSYLCTELSSANIKDLITFCIISHHWLLKSFPKEDKDLSILYNSYHSYWQPGNGRSPGISSSIIVQLLPEHSIPITRRVNLISPVYL